LNPNLNVKFDKVVTDVFANGTEFIFVQTVSIADSTLPTLEGSDVVGGDASGDQVIELSGQGFDTKIAYRSFLIDSNNNALASTPSYPDTSTSLSLLVPPWGFSFPAATVSLIVQYNASTSGERERRLLEQSNGFQARQLAASSGWIDLGVTFDYTFEAAVINYTTVIDFGSIGDTVLNVTAPGLDPSLEHTCIFTAEDGSRITASSSVAISVSSLVCVTPPWGTDRCASIVNISVIQGNSIVKPRGGQVITYDFFEAIESIINASQLVGDPHGGENVTLRGFGLCPNPSRDFVDVSCRFVSNDNTADFLDTRATFTPLGNVACLTPAWGYSFSDATSHVVLAKGLASARQVIPSGLAVPMVFTCCVVREFTVQEIKPSLPPAVGYINATVIASDFNIPFDYSLLTGDSVNVQVALPTEANKYTNAGVCSNASFINQADYGGDGYSLRFKTPPGAGHDLTLSVRFASLPLLRFDAARAFSFAPPTVTNVTKEKGPTDGGFTVCMIPHFFLTLK
jgi:hypothetical protein